MKQRCLNLLAIDAEKEAHPAYWAPFVVVGEGVAGVAARSSSSSVVATPGMIAAKPASAIVPTPTQPATASDPTADKKKMAPRPSPKTKAVDWKKAIFDR